MNCFLFYPRTVKWYLFHPWEFFEDTWSNFKAAWQRATKGYADRDTWDLDTYLLELIPNMVDHLRQNTHGYPGNSNFPTPEAWDEYLLKEIIIPLREANENKTKLVNEYEYIFEKYPPKIENGYFVSTIPSELMKKWEAEEKRIYSSREEQRIKGFTALLNEEVWHNLWD